jgi:hypothetical protein
MHNIKADGSLKYVVRCCDVRNGTPKIISIINDILTTFTTRLHQWNTSKRKLVSNIISDIDNYQKEMVTIYIGVLSKGK